MADGLLFHLESPASDIAVISINDPKKGANILSRPALAELDALLTSLEKRTDLAGLRPMPGSENQLLLIPFAHANAWLAALNAARLALFVLNELTAEAMEPDAFATVTPKQQEALLRIHLLAEVQSVLLGDQELESAGPFGDFVIE